MTETNRRENLRNVEICLFKEQDCLLLHAPAWKRNETVSKTFKLAFREAILLFRENRSKRFQIYQDTAFQKFKLLDR